ncbi:anaphase-promoting complex subunit CDC26 isoform 2-T3 [Callospermophilus lateralis]
MIISQELCNQEKRGAIVPMSSASQPPCQFTIISLFWTNMNGPYNYHNEHYGEKAGETVEWMYFSKIPFHQWQMYFQFKFYVKQIYTKKEKIFTEPWTTIV